jgi:hypothetical protein
LTRKNTFYCRYGVFKVHVSQTLTRRLAPTDGLSKLNSVNVEVDVIPGEFCIGRPKPSRSPPETSPRKGIAPEAANEQNACRSNCSDIP